MINNRSFILSTFLFSLIGMAVFFAACNKEEPLPDNPYDNVDYGNDTSDVPPPDPNSIVGIHQNIFQAKCNNPGCHDGTFEPDFRTVQSAYSTLVYHSIVKNTADSAYQFRVWPGDTSKSMLIHRVVTGDAALQQMPATGDYLTDAELNNIVTWIENGALDMFGNPPILPNNQPRFIGYIIMDSAFVRIDTARVDDIFYNPVELDNNKSIQMIMLVEDDSTAVEDMESNKLKFSYDMDDFSSATTYPAFYFSLLGFNVWVVNVNTGDFVTGSNVYFRYYFNDGDHAADEEFPKDTHEDAYKSYCAIYVKP